MSMFELSHSLFVGFPMYEICAGDIKVKLTSK